VGKENIIPGQCILLPSSLYKLRFHSVEILLFDVLAVWFKMQCGGVSCAKQARMLSGNEIREIVMDSDSDKDKYYDSVT
jgi:hypothetical protein